MLGKSIVMGITSDLLIAKEIGKCNGKGFRKEKWNFGTFIYENNGN